MGDDADDARYAEEQREQRMRDRQALGIASRGEQAAIEADARRVTMAAFGPPPKPQAEQWGKFALTTAERRRIVNAVYRATMGEQAVNMDVITTLVNDIEAIIAEDVEQCLPLKSLGARRQVSE